MPNQVITISARQLPTSPRKLRLAVSNLKGLTAERAMFEMRFLNKKAAEYALKALKQAVAAAKDYHLSASELRVAGVAVDGGSSIKRRMIGSRGRSSLIKKQRSHITIKLEPLSAAVEQKAEE